MAKNKLNEKLDKILEQDPPKDTIEQDDVPNPDPTLLEKIMDQRYCQRTKVFNVCIFIIWSSFILLILLIAGEAILRVFVKNIQILDGYMLEIFVVSVFGGILGILKIISRYIWDDKNYKEVLKRDYMKRKK